MGKTRTSSTIKVTHADGRTELRRPGHFRKRKTKRRRDWKAWRRVRQQAFERDGFKCVACGSSDKLHGHHLNYHRVGSERVEDIVTLCESCHSKEHAWGQRERRARGE